ncbi:hypothetical protein [Mesobacillus foraminis]|nr:hypothetical protein [Mesobacillus foraminis]
MVIILDPGRMNLLKESKKSKLLLKEAQGRWKAWKRLHDAFLSIAF